MVFLCAGAFAAGAQALDRNVNASVTLHLAAPASCAAILHDCEDTSLVVSAPLGTYYAILCIMNGDPETGLAGVGLGLDYDGADSSGVDLWSWTPCGTLQFAGFDWPAPRSGNVITWDPMNRCQTMEPGGAGTGVTALAGFFYLTAYSADRLEVIPRPVSQVLSVANCDAAEFILSPDRGGSVGFSADGSLPGWIPCVTRTVVVTTWGRLKFDTH
jgi:hypothetical protein